MGVGVKINMYDNVDDIIQHYASQYYNPQKAHDYYMRTRQLADNQPKLDKDQKKIFAVEKKGISDQKMSEVKGNRDVETVRLNALRQNAKETKDRITADLTKLFASLKGDKVKTAKAKKDAQLKRLKVSNNLKSAIASARASYKSQTAGIKSKYEQITAAERLKISNVDTTTMNIE